MVFSEKDTKETVGEVRMFKMVIAKILPRLGLKKTLIKTGDIAVQISRSATDDKVWKEARKILEKL